MDLHDLPLELQQMLQQFQAQQGRRSPVGQALTDLREPSDPKQRLHRPSFFFEMGPTLPPYRHQAYPKVKWHPTQPDTTVLTAEQEAALGDDWQDQPSGQPLNVAAQIQAEMQTLTPEERDAVLDAHRRARVELLQRKLSALTEAELAALTTEPKGSARVKRHGQ